MPPLTVASLATITHCVPEIVPIPVTRPAAGASSPYIPVAASAESSRNGVPGVDEPVDAVARGELAALAMAVHRHGSAAAAHAREMRA